MARFVQHKRAERLLVARVRGVVSRHAERPPVDEAAAVAEILAVTHDPHLLGHAWYLPPQYVVHTDPWADVKNELLGKAGADPRHPDREIVC